MRGMRNHEKGETAVGKTSFSSDGLQPKSDGLPLRAMASSVIAMASDLIYPFPRR